MCLVPAGLYFFPCPIPSPWGTLLRWIRGKTMAFLRGKMAKISSKREGFHKRNSINC